MIKDVLTLPHKRKQFFPHPSAGALVIKQVLTKADPSMTAGDSAQIRKITTSVDSVLISMQHINSTIAEGGKYVFPLLQVLGMIKDADRFANMRITMRAVTDLENYANAMHVKKDASAGHNKTIQFVATKSAAFDIAGKSELWATVVVATNEADNMAYVRFRREMTDELQLVENISQKRTLIHEHVLIFNRSPRLSIKFMPIQIEKPVVEHKALRVVDALFTTHKEKILLSSEQEISSNATQQYFDQQFPAYMFVSRNDPRPNTNYLYESRYCDDISTLVQNVRKLHYVYAYLRAVAAALVREMITDDKYAASKQSIIDAIESHITEIAKGLRCTPPNPLQNIISSVVVAARLVGCFCDAHVTGAVTLKQVTDEDTPKQVTGADTLKQVKQLYVQHDALPLDKVTVQDFGHVLAVYLFHTTDALEKTWQPDVQNLQDRYAHEMSGDNWRIAFTMNLNIHRHEDLKKLMTVAGTSFWMKAYDLFKEEPGVGEHKSKYQIGVHHKVQQRYEIFLHYPYTTLIGATSQ